VVSHTAATHKTIVYKLREALVSIFLHVSSSSLLISSRSLITTTLTLRSSQTSKCSSQQSSPLSPSALAPTPGPRLPTANGSQTNTRTTALRTHVSCSRPWANHTGTIVELICYTVGAVEACTYRNTNNLVPVGGACKYWYNAQGGINHGSRCYRFLLRSRGCKTLTVDRSLQGRCRSHWNCAQMLLSGYLSILMCGKLKRDGCSSRSV
jgi:hypothetical protein